MTHMLPEDERAIAARRAERAEVERLRQQLAEALSTDAWEKVENQRQRLDKLERKYATMKAGLVGERDAALAGLAEYGQHDQNCPRSKYNRPCTCGLSAALSAAREHTRERDEMVCDRCRRRHGVVWFAPSDVWNAVMRGGDRGAPDEFSFCCPICFITLAEERGIETTGWLVTPFSDGPVERADQVVLAAREHTRKETP